MINGDNNNDAQLYTSKDIQNRYRIGPSKTYQLFKIKGFPVFRLGNKYYVRSDELKKWELSLNQYKTYKISCLTSFSGFQCSDYEYSNHIFVDSYENQIDILEYGSLKDYIQFKKRT